MRQTHLFGGNASIAIFHLIIIPFIAVKGYRLKNSKVNQSFDFFLSFITAPPALFPL